MMDVPSIEAFGAWRGRPVDVVNVFTVRDTRWEPLTRPQELIDAFSGWPGRLVISQPLFPTDGNLAACARGDYDQRWREFGTFLGQVDGGRRASSFVRLGWEANGTYFYWKADRSGELYRACWNHAAAAVKTANPQAVLDWTVNAHGTLDQHCGGVELNCYPGDQWVDVVGTDNYDHYPPVRTQAEFDATAAAEGGLTQLYDFARAHGKLFSVGEWGVSSATTNDKNGGDNPFFVQAMWSWLVARAPYIAFEGYYTNCEPNNVRSDIAPYRNCGGPGQPINPNSSAQYRALWSAVPTS